MSRQLPSEWGFLVGGRRVSVCWKEVSGASFHFRGKLPIGAFVLRQGTGIYLFGRALDLSQNLTKALVGVTKVLRWLLLRCWFVYPTCRGSGTEAPVLLVHSPHITFLRGGDGHVCVLVGRGQPGLC